MSASNFLVVDEQPLVLEQAVSYLQSAGKFQPFLLEILSQHAINQALKAQPDLQFSPEDLEQVLIDFRVERELIDPQTFQSWLDSNGVSYETFRQQYVWHLTCERLKIWLSQFRLEAYFEERQPFLDRVILSWVVTDTKAMAEALHRQLEAGTPLEQMRETLATQNVENDQSQPLFGLWKRFAEGIPESSNVEMPLEVAIEESLSYGDLPEEVREAIAQAQPGSLSDPLMLDDNWYVFRLDALLPAELDDALATQLREEIFTQWLTEQVSVMNVKLEVN